jgi:rhamnulokinase
MSFVAVDLGASGGKVSVGTFGGARFELAEVHRFPNGGIDLWHAGEGESVRRTYWDYLALYEHVLTGLGEAAKAAPAPVAGVGIDFWGADAALVSRHGETLGEIFNYRDHRLDAVPGELAQALPPRRQFELTGLQPQPWYLLNQLFWFVRNRPEVLPLVQVALPLGTRLQQHLCGSAAAEQSWMAVQGLTRAGSGQYCDEVLQAAGIPRRILPQIATPGTVLGELLGPVAEATGLADCKVLAVKMHDTASAYAAAPVEGPARSLIISSGTWSLVGKRLDDPRISGDVFDAGLSNEGVRGDVRLLRNVMGTWPVQQLRAQWATADGRRMGWDEIVRLAESAPPLVTLIDVDDPALFNPPDMQAAIHEQIRRTGQPPPAGRGALLRAVYEGLALAVARVNRRLAGITGSPQEVVHIIGGGARNALLNQLIADATGLPVLAGPAEATSIGNCLVQAAALGAIGSIEQGRRIVADSMPLTRFDPSGDPKWTDALQRFEGMDVGGG